jgi:hypothetical protein
MSAPVRIVRILPELLGLNGSLGNAEVLQARLKWWSVDTQLHDVRAGEDLPDSADIVVLGSGTSSVVEAAAPEFSRWAKGLHRFNEQGSLWCGIGLGGDLLGQSVTTATGEVYQGLGLTPISARQGGARFSAEVSGKDAKGRPVAGYLNDYTEREGSGVTSLINLDVTATTQWSGYTSITEEGVLGDGVSQENLWVSTLSGPLLALNPAIADDILYAWAKRDGTPLPEHTATHQLADFRAEKARQGIVDRLNTA